MTYLFAAVDIYRPVFAKAKVKKLSSQIGMRKNFLWGEANKKHRILKGEKPEKKKLSRGRVNIA